VTTATKKRTTPRKGRVPKSERCGYSNTFQSLATNMQLRKLGESTKTQVRMAIVSTGSLIEKSTLHRSPEASGGRRKSIGEASHPS
jgi:hypothetical protein